MRTHEQAAAPENCDVLVIGGGPAGSTVATLLAEKGHHVVMLEKDRHPRFHIGESLLPANLPLFERLGVAEEMRAIGVVKPGAEFVSIEHGRAQTFHFADAWDKTMPFAYQVKRAEFDQVLSQNAARHGATVIEGCRVKNVQFEGDECVFVDALQDSGESRRWQARFLVDASGRDTFLARRFQIKHRNPRHNSSAVYGHFRDVKRHSGADEGNISIFWFEHGWFWFIPMRGGVTSVGMVVWPYYLKTRNERDMQQFLLDSIKTCAPLAERMQNAELMSRMYATGNFSYLSERNHGRNYVLLGDAFAFIDPVFSSGVWFAMKSGELAAGTIDTCLRQPAQATAALKRFDRLVRHGPKAFSWFIYRMTNPVMRDLFMNPKNVFRVKEALLSVLAGDIFDKTPIWRSLWMFKLIYYVSNLAQPRRAFTGWKNRRANIRPADVSLPDNV